MAKCFKNCDLVIARVLKVSKNNFIKLEAEFLRLDKKNNKFWKVRERFWSSLTDEPYRVGDIVLAQKYGGWKRPLPPSPTERMISDFNRSKFNNALSKKPIASNELQGPLPPSRPSWMRPVVPKKEQVESRGKDFIIVKLVEPSMDIITGEVTDPIMHHKDFERKTKMRQS